MQYPEWWQGYEEIQHEAEYREAKEAPHQSNPVKAKVHKNMRRYAEDSLDARLRQAQQNTNPEPREQASPSMQDSRAYQDQSQIQSEYSSINPNAYRKVENVGSIVSSQSNLVAYMNRDQQSMFQTETAPRNFKEQNPASDPRNTKTNESGSFAYTSSKHVPKYSPVRDCKPGQQNTPMTYAGPPNKAELARNAKRSALEAGNRNFNQQVAEQPNLQAHNRPRPQTAKPGGCAQKGGRQSRKQVKQQKDF